MARILINTAEVVNSGSKARAAKSTTGSVVGRIAGVRSGTDSQILSRGGLGSRLDAVYNKVAQLEREIAAIQNAVENGAMQYQRTEASLDNLSRMIMGVNAKSATASTTRSALEQLFTTTTKPLDISEELQKFLSQPKSGLTEEQLKFLKDIAGRIEKIKVAAKEESEKKLEWNEAEWQHEFGKTVEKMLGVEYVKELSEIFGEASLIEFLGKISTANTDHYFVKAEGKAEDEMTTSMNFEDNKKVGDKIDNWVNERQDMYGIPHEKEEIEKYYDENGNEISKEDAEKFYEREITLAELNHTESVSVSLYDGEYRIGEKGKITATVCEAEAHAGISVGMYVIAADGSRRFSPGVKAEIGTSVTAFEAEWEQQWLGDEMLGLNTDITATVGRAEASAEAVAQIWGENGELDMQLNASASAELIGGELEGSAGINILGGEIGVKGSVNYGIGAHAEVGIKDGVIKCDIGASLGVGVSVGFEVDVGGMVDTVADAASAAWVEATDFVSEGWNSLKSGWNSLFG